MGGYEWDLLNASWLLYQMCTVCFVRDVSRGHTQGKVLTCMHACPNNISREGILNDREAIPHQGEQTTVHALKDPGLACIRVKH
jgi:hypothetical protein